VVALGSKSDYKLTPWPSLKNLVGELSVRELLAVIKRLDLFVGVDSGPMHVAAAWNTPIVGLFGCVNPELRRPFGSIFEPVTAGVECSGCLARMPIPSYDAKCENGTFHCMKMITVAAVKEAVGRALEKAGRKPGWRSGGEGLACLLEDDHLEPGQDMEILTSSTGPPSLRIKRNGQAAVTMHSTKDPETEARRWADQTGGKGDAVVLGLGLGYHVAALLERTPLSAQMVVVEKEAAIFDLALRAGALGRFALDPRLRLMVGLEPVEAARRLMALDLSPGCRLAVHQSSARLSPDYYRLLERHFSAREAREG